MENVSHIGIIYGSMKFGVQLQDKGRYSLYTNWERCPEHADYYTENGKSCHEEYDFIEATKRLKRIGTDIPLADGEYMPLIRQWDIMGMFKTNLQKALCAAGGYALEPDCWYWSISELQPEHRLARRLLGWLHGQLRQVQQWQGSSSYRILSFSPGSFKSRA